MVWLASMRLSSGIHSISPERLSELESLVMTVARQAGDGHMKDLPNLVRLLQQLAPDFRLPRAARGDLERHEEDIFGLQLLAEVDNGVNETILVPRFSRYRYIGQFGVGVREPRVDSGEVIKVQKYCVLPGGGCSSGC